MKKILLPVKMIIVLINNIFVFLSVVIPRRIPIYKWPLAWRLAMKEHERDIARMANQLTMQGRLKRRIDKNGQFVYYPMDRE